MVFFGSRLTGYLSVGTAVLTVRTWDSGRGPGEFSVVHVNVQDFNRHSMKPVPSLGDSHTKWDRRERGPETEWDLPTSA